MSNKLESPDQFIYKMKTYLEKWIELYPSKATYQGLRDLIIKEQVWGSFPEDLSIHLHERSPATLDEPTRWPRGKATGRGAGRSGFESRVEVMLAKGMQTPSNL